MSRSPIFAVLIACLATIALANSCNNPKVSVKSFSTVHATILVQLAHVGEFTLQCDDDAQPNLFAEFPCGKVIPVARVGDAKYQISWTEDIKKSSSGNINIRLLDEEGYANIRKAQRDGENASNVKSLIDITINAKGAYKGPWVNAELVAALLVALVAYYASTTKIKLQG